MMNRTILLAAALLLSAPVAHAADLTVSDAFARASPGRGPGAAYVTIHGGDAADRLLSVTSPRSPEVEMHSMVMQGNVMRMRQLDAIDIPANGTVRLAPGGLHIMLQKLAAPLKAGETLPLTLKFEHAGERTVQVPVEAIGASGPKAMGAMPGMGSGK